LAFFGLGRKNESIPPMEPQMQPSSTPVDAVMQMRQQGFSNNQIIENLQRDGYNSDQIFDAINQADVKGGVEAMPQSDMQQMPPLDNPIPESSYYEQPQQAQPYRQYEHHAPSHTASEEMIEAVVNEKFEELMKDFKKFDDWKEKTDDSLSKMQQSIADLKNNFDKLHQAIIGKIAEYDQNIINVGTEIKAMEKVFQKVLPTFTENIQELSRMTKNLKTTKPSK